ncbi:uncharacterized protein LOC126672915 [Mercurialis annua]|uniref:uncharacterized protein LOC126672915 n=1 Tax=Mercurialis annua TaxID=3986 RepID=UPI0021607053|nr:uncharacterized protein LOC126672915 [Mercurialis annua]
MAYISHATMFASVSKKPCIQTILKETSIATEKPSFAEIITGKTESLIPSAIPENKGGFIAIKVNQERYEKRIKECEFALIGRIILNKGDTPWKVTELKKKLNDIWRLNNTWRLISIGKGFYYIILSSMDDKTKVWGMGSINIKPGIIRLQPWIPDFNPTDQKSTNAQVWVRFYRLPWDYWDVQTLADTARGIGIPLRIDAATANGELGHFARVLIDVDLASELLNQLLIERVGKSFFIDVIYEHLPNFCHSCKSIGHLPSQCRSRRSFVQEELKKTEEVKRNKNSELKKQWVPKSAAMEASDDVQPDTEKLADIIPVVITHDDVIHEEVLKGNTEIVVFEQDQNNISTEPPSIHIEMPLAFKLPSMSHPEYFPDQRSLNQEIDIPILSITRQSWADIAEKEDSNLPTSSEVWTTVTKKKRNNKKKVDADSMQTALNPNTRVLVAVNSKELPSLWVLSNSSLLLSNYVDIGIQHVSFDIYVNNSCHRISCVYGSTCYRRRLDLWSSLSSSRNSYSGSWVIIGDFNAVRNPSEKTGRPPLERSMADFRDFIDNFDLANVSLQGALYTWSNGRIGSNRVECLLDRALISKEFADHWHFISSSALPRHHSDHNPIIFRASISLGRISRFQFQSMWIAHPDFMDFIRCNWSDHSVLGPFQSFLAKLKVLRFKLRHWNNSSFGRLNSNIKEAENRLSAVQTSISSLGLTEALHKQELDAHVALDLVLKQQEIYFKEKSRVKWLKEGDRNSEFFHRSCNFRKAKMGIHSMLIDGVLSDNMEHISNHITSYYANLFSATRGRPSDLQIVKNIIPHLVTDEDNDGLTRCPSNDEIRATVFDMDGSSAPGPDGFSGAFYKYCWNIIGLDLCRLVCHFFQFGKLTTGLCSSLMVLIPKFKGAVSIDQFRPIVLSNFCFKVITKILADRLASIAEKIISKHQFGFIKNRSISHCIATASEGVNVLNKRCFGGNMALQIDIKKAFDTMEWSFILEVLDAFGFSLQFRDWVLEIFSSARLSVILDGSTAAYFSCSRGVRQGDPLSPLLFCLAEDFLSRLITSYVQAGKLQQMNYSKGSLFASHLFYADDMLVFCKASLRNVKALKSIFNVYGKASGQCVSWEKSFAYYGCSISETRVNSLCLELNIKRGSLPFNYLGVPLFAGAPRKIYLQSIADKVTNKFAGWKGSALSMAGRVTLVNSVILSSLLHSFSIYKWPTSLIEHLEKCIRNFIWTGSIEKTKLVTVPWRICCRAVKDGGLGMKNLKAMNKAMLSKIAWDMISSDTFPLNILKSRFLTVSGVPKKLPIGSSFWSSIREVYASDKVACRWIIGENSRLNFWTDEWIVPTVAERMNLSYSVKSKKTDLVTDFFINESWILPSYISSDIGNAIRSISPCRDTSDTCLWEHSLDGKFKVSLAYILTLGVTEQVPWSKFLWKEILPPSRSMICWRAFLGYLPTENNLQKKGFNLVSRCSLCNNNREDVDHLFVNCSFSHALWMVISSIFDRQINTNGSLHSLIMDASNEKFSPQVFSVWNVAVVTTIWSIWKHRNMIIFDGQLPNIHGVIRKILCCLKECDFLSLRHCNNSINDMITLKLLRIKSVPRKPQRVISVVWRSPPTGWIKVNTDGSALGAPGPAGGGGIFRNTRGFCQGCFALHLGCSFAFMAEIEAAIYAVLKASEMGFQFVWLECDSIYVVNLFKRRDMQIPWKLRLRWIACLKYINSIQFVVSHIFREGNAVADDLARHGALNNGVFWWNQSPDFCNDSFYHDFSRKERWRIG